MEIKKGDIFYNTTTNTYYIVSGCVFIDELKYLCMMFTGYETNHEYLKDAILYAETLKDSRMVQVGGIY